jgi:hypothetical protein
MKNEITKEHDTLNGTILCRYEYCKRCNEGVTREKYLVKTKFINVGNEKQDDEFICTSCGTKVDFSGKKLVINRFGYYLR